MIRGYNIVFEQPERFTEESKDEILLAAHIIGTRLKKFTGLSAEESFNKVFGKVNVRFTSGMTYHAKAIWGVIRYASNDFVTTLLTIHELGHIFCVLAANLPSKTVAKGLDIKGGSDWPGKHPPSMKEYNAVEKFVNLWEIWILDLFADTDAGYKLRKWFDIEMEKWIAKILGVEENVA